MERDLQPTAISNHFLVRLLLAFAFALALGTGASDDSSSSSAFCGSVSSTGVLALFFLSFFSGFKIVLARSGKDITNSHGKNRVKHWGHKSTIITLRAKLLEFVLLHDCFGTPGAAQV